MTDLAEFLLARIEEDQVKRATMREWHAQDCDAVPQFGSEYTYPCNCGVPERMAAECEAKRRIIEHHARRPDPEGEDAADLCAICSANGPQAQGWPCETLQLLALPYADHPDYREEWRP